MRVRTATKTTKEIIGKITNMTVSGVTKVNYTVIFHY